MLSLLNRLHAKSMHALLLDFFPRHELLQELQAYPEAAGFLQQAQ